MIRRKVSTGLLRSAQSASKTSATSSSAAVAASPMQQQSASLASAVLLNSQRNWKGETVATLKGELKKRGLSQTGNKSTLVARLSSAETSQHLPPTPTVPSSFRKISTSSPAGADKKSSPPKQDDTVTKIDSKEMTTGPEISSKTAEAEAFDEPTKEQLNVAPGLPESGKAAPSSGEKLSVKMPKQAEAEGQNDQVIPLEPDNFQAKVKNQLPDEKETKDQTPKVMTVASASTHLSGGPVSAVHEATDASKSELESKASEAKEAVESTFEGAGKTLASAVNSLASMKRTAGEFSRSFVPEINLPETKDEKDGKKGEYKAPEKGLDHDEKRGVWVLGGIVGLGLLVGGLGSGSGAGDKKDKIKGAVAAAVGKEGVKGDDKWAEASGAGVVGHGARKD